jgi:hypothetical protein
MLEELPTTAPPTNRAKPFSEEELARIDAMLGCGWDNKAILAALKIPQSTFYARLQKSGKRIGDSAARKLVDI